MAGEPGIVPSEGAWDAVLPMRSMGGRRVGNRTRHDRSECPGAESVLELTLLEEEEDDETDDAVLLLERVLSKLRLGGIRGGTGVQTVSICVCQIYACETYQWCRRVRAAYYQESGLASH